MKKPNRNSSEKSGKIEINISVEVGNKRTPVKITILLGIVAAVIVTISEVIKLLN